MMIENNEIILPTDDKKEEVIKSKEDRIFPSVEEYENDPVVNERRTLLLEIIKELRAAEEYFFSNHKSETGIIVSQDDLINRVNKLLEPLRNLGITKEYLDSFSDPVVGNFVEPARRSPKIMTEWIAHDLISIVDRAKNVKTPAELYGTFSAFAFFEKVLDAE